MTPGVSRTDRRRRALQEGALEGEPAHTPTILSTAVAGPAYDQPAASLGFALAERLTPRSPWLLALATLGVGGACVGATLAIDQIAASVPGSAAEVLQLGGPRSLLRWTASVMLLAAAAIGVLVYSLRRRRTDDFNGAYRWWIVASLGLAGWSVAHGLGLGGDAAALASQRFGLDPANAPTIVALVAVVVFLLPVAVRLGWQARGSAMATTYLSFAQIAYLGSFVSLVAQIPAVWATVTWYALPLVGHTLLMAAMLAFARQMVTEANAPVNKSADHPAARVRTKRSAAKADALVAVSQSDPTPSSASSGRSTAETASESRRSASAATSNGPKPQVAAEPSKPAPSSPRSGSASSSREPEVAKQSKDNWVGGAGSRFNESYEDEEGGGARLSKADRKRLRREQARDRAA